MPTQVNIPQSPLVDLQTGYPSPEWLLWLLNPQVLNIVIGSPITVPSGGTGITSGTSGGVLAFTSATTIASSAELTANHIVLGGGAGVAPYTLGDDGTVTTVLHGNAGGAPSFGPIDVSVDLSGTLSVPNGGTGLTGGISGGIPAFNTSSTIISSGELVRNRLVLGGGAGTTPYTPVTLGTTTTLLHGNASGAPSWGAVNLATEVTGNLAVSHLNSGTSAGATTFWRGDGTWATPSGGGGTGASLGVVLAMQTATGVM